MKRYFILLCFLLTGIAAFSQTKITGFSGETILSKPTNFQKVGVINDRLTFIADDGYRKGLWTTDGTPTGTTFLLPFEGINVQVTDAAAKKVEVDKIIYLTNYANNQLLQTDGRQAALLFDVPDGKVYNPQKFGDNLYVVVDSNRVKNNLFIVTGLGKVKAVVSNFGAFKFTARGLFYIQADEAKTVKYLYFYDGKTTMRIREHSKFNALDDELDVYVSNDEAFIVANDDYPDKQLIVYNLAKRNILQAKSLGEAFPSDQSFVIDQNGNPYILKLITDPAAPNSARVAMEVNVIGADYSFIPIANLPYSGFLAAAVPQSGFETKFLPAYISGSEFVYQITTTQRGSGIPSFYGVGSYNLNFRVWRYSDNFLNKLFVRSYAYPSLKPNAGGRVKITDVRGNQLDYSFENNALTFEAGPESSSDSVAIVNQRRLVISDNVYQMNGGITTALVSPQRIFVQNDFQNLTRQELNDKLILLRTSTLPTATGFELGSVDVNGHFEKLLRVPNEYVRENSLKKLTNFNGKSYFITKKGDPGGQSVEHSVYATDGTTATTSKIGSFTSPLLTTRETFTNNKQLVFFMEESSSTKSAIVKIENDKISKATLINRSGKIYQTSEATYFVNNREAFSAFQDIFLMKDSRLELIAENTSNHIATEAALIYTKSSLDKNENLGVFMHKNTFEKLIADKAFNAVRKVDNRVVIKNSTSSNWLIYDSANERELLRLTRPELTNVEVVLANGALVLVEPEQLTVLKGINATTVKLEKPFGYSNIQPVANGFLMLSNLKFNLLEFTDVSYYNLVTDEIRKVGIPASLENVQVNADEKYAVFAEKLSGGRGFAHWFWDETMSELKKISNDDYNSIFLTSAGRILLESTIQGAPFSQRVWYHSPGKFEVVATVANALETGIVQLFKPADKAAIAYSYTNTTSFTDYKIRQYTKNKTINFPTINAEQGGANLLTVFPFQGQLYGYAFTYADGWQIWNLGELTEEEVNYLGEIALANEEVALKVNVFPNPTSDELTVISEEPVYVEMLNLTGISVATSATQKTHSFFLKNLPAGMYLLVIKNEKKMVVRKVVKE